MASEQELVAVPAPSLWDQYLHGLQTRPVLVKSGTAATLLGLQEVIATLVTGGRIDSKGAKMAAYGFAISGPLGHYLYLAVDRAFKGRSGLGWTLARLLTTNLIVSPILNCVYIFSMATIAGQKAQAALATVRARIWSVQRTTWIVFPIVQTFAFRFLPPSTWLPFFNLVSFSIGLYINILTKLAARKKAVSGGTKRKAI